jgi:micrococcal nuclease
VEHREPSRRRQFRRSPYRTLVLILVLGAIAVGRYWQGDRPGDVPSELTEGTYRLVRVVDGDTIIVAPHVVVRLIGVDTPETVKPEHPIEAFGPEATAFTREFLADGTMRLSFDRERVDRFGRHLAYVWVGDRLLNEELARAGLARFESHFHYSPAMKRRFHQAQQEAQKAHRGIWSLPAPDQPAGAPDERAQRPGARPAWFFADRPVNGRSFGRDFAVVARPFRGPPGQCTIELLQTILPVFHFAKAVRS